MVCIDVVWFDDCVGWVCVDVVCVVVVMCVGCFWCVVGCCMCVGW